MGITHSSIVTAPVEDVFAWHERPGAFARLSAPWQSARILRQSDSLEDGQAILRLPGGLTWVSRHDPNGYRPPHRFVDTVAADGISSRAISTLLRWRHTHEFVAVDSSRTRVTDTVETPLGSHLLRPMFVYRHQQLADDLAAHSWAATMGAQPLTIAVTGSSGLVGSALCAFLTTGGHRVVHLVRRDARTPNERRWDPMNPHPALLDGIDALIHLAGESIAGRFTSAHKHAVRESRITPTRRLSELAALRSADLKTVIVASAIGYYGADRGEEILTENSARGDGFLAELVADWEAAAQPASAAGIRVTTIRTGIVQSTRGGTLPLFRTLFSLGLGGQISTGRQWLSWIDLDDLVDVYHRALIDPRLVGPVNAVAPRPVRNTEFARTLARVLKRPALIPVPRLGPQLILGEEGSRELAEANQNVTPGKLRAEHQFRREDLEDSLRHQLGRHR